VGFPVENQLALLNLAAFTHLRRRNRGNLTTVESFLLNTHSQLQNMARKNNFAIFATLDIVVKTTILRL